MELAELPAKVESPKKAESPKKRAQSDDDWEVNASVVKRARKLFADKAAGEAEIPMKVANAQFTSSKVKMRDIVAVWAFRGRFMQGEDGVRRAAARDLRGAVRGGDVYADGGAERRGAAG